MKMMLIFGIAVFGLIQLSADFVTDYPKANGILPRKPKEAQIILEKLLTEPLTPAQKDQVLSDLIYANCRQRQFSKAEKYLEQITEKPLQTYNKMRLLNTQSGKQRQVAELFGKEDIAKWPERLAYRGYSERAYSYSLAGKNVEALADAQKSLEACGSDRFVRLSMLQLAGQSCQRLKDHKKALEYYEDVLKIKSATGGAAYLHSALATAGIYLSEKRYAEAEKVLEPIKKTHPGYYTSMVCHAYGDLYTAQGKHQEAAEYYQQCINEKNGNVSIQKKAKEKLEKLAK